MTRGQGSITRRASAPGSSSLEAGVSPALETSPHHSTQPKGPDLAKHQQIVGRLTEITRANPIHDGNEGLCFIGRLAVKIRDCSRFAWLCRNVVTDEAHVTVSRCKSRLCPTCGAARSRKVACRVRGYASMMSARRFLTLTLSHSDTPLRDQIERLTTSFAKLRRTKWWRRLCPGGIFTIETKYNTATDRWHPHLHAIIDGEFIPQSKLSQKWGQITGDSYIVDIRQVYSSEVLAKYIAKYVAKTQDMWWLPDDRLVEWAHEVHGLRLVNTFGKLHGVKLDNEHEYPKQKLERVAPLHAMRMAMFEGDATAARLHELCTGLLYKKFAVDSKPLLLNAQAWWSAKNELVRDLPKTTNGPPTARPPDPQGQFEHFNDSRVTGH